MSLEPTPCHDTAFTCVACLIEGALPTQERLLHVQSVLCYMAHTVWRSHGRKEQFQGGVLIPVRALQRDAGRLGCETHVGQPHHLLILRRRG